MTSNTSVPSSEAYVWIWLPNQCEPVVAGRLEKVGSQYLFNYGKKYLARDDAISIHDGELPLGPGQIDLKTGLSIPGCIRDAAPDSWGRQVVVNKMLGSEGQVDDLDELTYLLESGSDRIGALDFHQSAIKYEPRIHDSARLEELMQSAEKVQRKEVLSEALDRALIHGSSIGGARPKALLDDKDKKYIAKFSSSDDSFDMVKAEYIAMRLAKWVGLNVAEVQIAEVMGKSVLLVERFDRVHSEQGWQRKILLSALTLLELDEFWAQHASYEDFAEKIRHKFENPKETLRELFSRMVFNVLMGNTDDHARNHAAFWDGKTLSLTPAYDICPQKRGGQEVTQAMKVFGDRKESRIATCAAAAKNFLLTEEQAIAIAEKQKVIIREKWQELVEEVKLGDVDNKLLWEWVVLNEAVDWPLESN